MTASLTIKDLFSLILFLLGIGIGVYLVAILSKVNRIMAKTTDMIEDNIEELDATIKTLPEISHNVSEITKETNYAITKLTPEVEKVLRDTSHISGAVSEISDSVGGSAKKLEDAVDGVSDSVLGVASNLESSSGNISYYMNYMFEMMDVIREVVFKGK